ncbi:GNAT family N-acetyltransferase [Marmoricola sp. URHA0025 HA25]
MTPDELLKVYDDEVRGSFADRLPPGWSGEQDGPLTRCLTGRAGFAMLTGRAEGLAAADLRGLVERTVAYFATHGRWFEWKTFDHDPPGLRPLLLEWDPAPQPHETLVMGEAALLAAEPVLPAGLTLREATSRADLERVAALQTEVWGEDGSWLADDLELRVQADPPTVVLLVEDGDLTVSAAWLAPFAGTSVAGLWGGSTLAAYRGRGIYRALVARRAQLAVERGHRFLQVDASDDSRPILERLGLAVVGGTTPYLFGRDDQPRPA